MTATNTSWDVESFVVEPEEGKTRFHDLSLPKALMHAISDLGFRYASPIQSESLPIVLDGEDIVAKAQTCLLYTSPSPRDRQKSRMPSSA